MIWRGSWGSASTWIAVILTIIVMVAVVVVIAEFWSGLGDSEISLTGWFAMGFGIIVTLALGIGLMSLVFFSSRGGYDETTRNDR
jgi:hypothetical protein